MVRLVLPLQIPAWIIVVACFVVLCCFLKQLKQRGQTSENSVSRKLMILFLVIVVGTILYSVSIIVRLSFCDPSNCSPSGEGLSSWVDILDFGRGMSTLIIFFAQNTFYLYRLKSCFQGSIYSISNRTIYTSLFAMFIAAVCLISGWVSFTHSGLQRKIFLTLCIIIGAVSTFGVSTRIAYHFVHKLLLLIAQTANNEFTSVNRRSKTHNNDNNNNNNNSIIINNNDICESKTDSVHVGDKKGEQSASRIPIHSVPTTPSFTSAPLSSFRETIDKMDDITLTKVQEQLIKTINKQTLLVITSLIPMLIIICMKIVLVFMTPNDDVYDQQIDSLGVLFFMIEPFVLLNTVVTIWLSFVIAKKTYDALCQHVDKGCEGMWEKIARYAIAKNVIKQVDMQ